MLPKMIQYPTTDPPYEVWNWREDQKIYRRFCQTDYRDVTDQVFQLLRDKGIKAGVYFRGKLIAEV